MTAKEFYEIDSGFRSLIGLWVSERSPPYPIGDYLEDNGLLRQAAGARWALSQPERRVYAPLKNEPDTPAKVFPATNRKNVDKPDEENVYPDDMDFWWYLRRGWQPGNFNRTDNELTSDDLPELHFLGEDFLSIGRNSSPSKFFPTPAAAILHMLDSYYESALEEFRRRQSPAAAKIPAGPAV